MTILSLGVYYNQPPAINDRKRLFYMYSGQVQLQPLITRGSITEGGALIDSVGAIPRGNAQANSPLFITDHTSAS